jgi:hypothetical protein
MPQLAMKHATKHVQKIWQLWAKRFCILPFVFSLNCGWLNMASESMIEEMAGISQYTQTLLSFCSVSVSKHQICHHNCNFCGSHNLLLLLRSLFFVLHTWACWDVLCTYTWLGPRHFASGSIAHTKFCPFTQSDNIFEVFLCHGLHDLLILFYFISFLYGHEKEFHLGITPNQLSIRNCEDG